MQVLDNDVVGDLFWDEILERITNSEIVPIVGPGAVTFGAGNELLYPWLATQLPAALDPPLSLANPRDLQEVVDAQRAQGRPVDRIHKRLYKLVDGLQPGVTVTSLGSIEGFRLFISTTFDMLLPQASQRAFPGGQPKERHGAASLREVCPDLPREVAKLEYPYVYQILGCANSPVRDFVVWDDDLLLFLLRLNQELPRLPAISEALQKSHFLALGLNFAEWLLRFFVQVVKQQRLSEITGTELLVFERLEPGERDKVVIYFSRLTKQIRIFPIDPVEFVAELHRRWRERHPAKGEDPFEASQRRREKHRAKGCIFVSYTSQDLEVARYVVKQLQDAGCPVWFDKEQIQAGEKWEETLRETIDERCGLFLSIISVHTATALEGWDLMERNLAARRRERLAHNAVFYLPLRVDDGEPLVPTNEPLGTAQLHAVRKPGGQLDPEFVQYLRQKQRENSAALGYPVPPEQ